MKTPINYSSRNFDQPGEHSSELTARPSLTHEDLGVLKAKFPRDRLGIKVQSYNREKTKAMLVLYLQHTDVQDRLEEVDPSWTSEVLTEQTLNNSFYVRLRLTLKGVSRENVGEGSDPKGAYSDALKRCAMLFGIGRYLYDSPIVWCDYEENRDRFRQWNLQDYERALQPRKPQTQSGTSAQSRPADASATASAASKIKPQTGVGLRIG